MRRLRFYKLTGGLLASVLKTGRVSICIESDLPTTARFYTAHFSPESNLFLVAFEDESFDEVKEGQMIPIHDLNVTEIVDDLITDVITCEN